MQVESKGSKVPKVARFFFASGVILALTCLVYTTYSMESIASDTRAIRQDVTSVVAAVSDTAIGSAIGSKIKRSTHEIDTNMLVPHPYANGLMMLPVIYPNVTSSTGTSPADLEKRYLWWVLGFVWKTAETGIALRALYKDCKDWSKDEADNWGKFQCVYGAVSTLMTVAGAGWAKYQYGSGIWHALQNILEKREFTQEISNDYLNKLRELQVVAVNHTGLPWSPIFDDFGYLLLDERADSSPIYFGEDFNGVPAHMSYNYVGGTNHSVVMNFRHFSPSNDTLSKREQFNEQDFSSGGIEAGLSYDQNADGGWLDPTNDYGQMDHEASCYLGDMNNNGLQFQIYDNNHKGTIAAGNLRACQEGSYDRDSLFRFSLPTPQNSKCQVS